MASTAPAPASRGFFRAIGPAIIVASVVVGPGSILTSSKVGASFGYELTWLLVFAALLMIGMIGLAARIAIGHERSPGTALREIVGSWFAVAIGVAMFLICACFQFGNNLAILAAIEIPLDGESALRKWLPDLLLLLFNAFLIAVLFRGREGLYGWIEKTMMVLVGIMLLAFAANVVFARPSLAAAFKGLVPSLPANPDLIAATGLFATTFSVAGAYYQIYMVREKGWGPGDTRQGMVDTLAGVFVLGAITLMIMLTSAAALRGVALGSVHDVAAQLKPLFNRAAVPLFSLGLLAAASSSLLVNAMIGATALSDGLGKGSRISEPMPRRLTIVALILGMLVAMAARHLKMGVVPLVVFAQAVTIIGVPLLAVAMLILARRVRELVPGWMFGIGVVGLVATVALAVRTVWSLVRTHL